MSNHIYLIPVALVLGGIGLAGFLWALRNGQYDDLEGAAMRILLDEGESDGVSHQPGRAAPGGRDAKGQPQTGV
jgi:cbb3-type cytochrome oxidase maturation protein